MDNGWWRHAVGVRNGKARRVIRMVAATVLALSLGVLASDTRVAPVTNAQAAGMASQPLHEFGYAHGTVSDLSLTDMRHYLDAIAKVTGPGGIVRAPLHWDPLQAAGPSWSRYDTFLDEVRARDLVFLPEIHISHDGHYLLPTQAPGTWAAWQADIRAIAQHYGPGGIYADSHPGFPGITRYEIWNEPNTPTGNATPNHDGSVDMDPRIAAQIMKTGAEALRQQASADGWAPEVVGPAIGAIDLAYLGRLKAADPALLSYVDTLSVHVYMRLDPDTCPIGEVRCIRTLTPLRTWLDSNGGGNVKIAITEGGYSGSNDGSKPTNVVTEALQATWGKGAVDWVRAHPELDVELYTPYNPLDKGATYTGDDYSYWYDNLGAVRSSDLALKPWGATYRALIDAYSGSSTADTQAPSVPVGLEGASPTATTPSLTWTAATDNIGVTGYQVFRNGTLVGSPSGTSFTDSSASQGTLVYTVKARDAAGKISGASAPVTIVFADATAPHVPAGLSAASPTATAPSLSWTASIDPDDAVTGYAVYRGGVQVGTPAGTSFTDLGAAYGGTYAYTVAARDSHGNLSPKSAPVSVTYADSSAPSTPSGLGGTTPTDAAPRVTWSPSIDVDDPVSAYVVFRDGVQLATTGAASYTDTAATPGASYSYTVAARDSHGNQSPQSAAYAVVYRDATPPTAPTELTGVTPTTSAPALNWAPATDPDDPVVRYRVYRNGVQIGTTTATSFTDDGAGRPASTLLSDAFSRSLSNWGSPPSGGSYGYNTARGGFWTNGANGVMQLTGSAKTLQAGLARKAQSVDMQTTFAITKRPVGDSVRLVLLARAKSAVTTTDAYRAVVMVNPSGTLVYAAQRVVADSGTVLGTLHTAPFAFAGNQRYHLRLQVTGASPTTIRVKLWRDGTPEPTTWGSVATDSAAALQGPGMIAVRSVTGTHVSNLPIAALVDSMSVTDLAPSLTHVYTVRAEDTYGNLSPASAPFAVTIR